MKKFGKVFLVLLVFLSLIILRIYLGSKEFYRKGKFFERKGDYIVASSFYERSARLYFPKNLYAERSLKRLFDIAKRFYDMGDYRASLNVYRRIRSTLYVCGLHPELIAELDLKISKIFPLVKSFPKRFEEKSYEERSFLVYKNFLNIYQPNYLFLGIVRISFIGFFVSAIYLSLFGFDSELKVRREIVTYLLLVILSFLVFIISLPKV